MEGSYRLQASTTYLAIAIHSRFYTKVHVTTCHSRFVTHSVCNVNIIRTSIAVNEEDHIFARCGGWRHWLGSRLRCGIRRRLGCGIANVNDITETVVDSAGAKIDVAADHGIVC